MRLPEATLQPRQLSCGLRPDPPSLCDGRACHLRSTLVHPASRTPTSLIPSAYPHASPLSSRRRARLQIGGSSPFSASFSTAWPGPADRRSAAPQSRSHMRAESATGWLSRASPVLGCDSPRTAHSCHSASVYVPGASTFPGRRARPPPVTGDAKIARSSDPELKNRDTATTPAKAPAMRHRRRGRRSADVSHMRLLTPLPRRRRRIDGCSVDRAVVTSSAG